MTSFFKHAKGQKLTDDQCLARLNFCLWFQQMLEIFPDFAQIIIWGDEKYFLKEQPHNPKNTGTWSDSNPNVIANIKDQAAEKAFAFVVMVDGKILPVMWCDKDPETKKVSMNGKKYLECLKKIVAQFSRRQLKNLWWMQVTVLPTFLFLSLKIP